MSERANPVVAQTLEEGPVGVHRKQTSEEVTSDLSMREAKRSKQEKHLYRLYLYFNGYRSKAAQWNTGKEVEHIKCGMGRNGLECSQAE
uniref:Uncharacterized protein n=1 Tax=Moniliophthora roreri TaxID=221103 RepID=A0A0W0GBX2_MONRR